MSKRKQNAKPTYNLANGAPRYWVMDGRALLNIDDALVLDTARTLELAVKAMQGCSVGDACIVDTQTDKVIDSMTWRNQAGQTFEAKQKIVSA
ncbi:MAG: hypothetical protein WAU96_04955 [Anaerolineae bacterium]